MTTRAFGRWSGVGLVIANMVGAGVFLSTGFMSQSLSPGLILLNWLVGAVMALCGARAYAEVARRVPKGGGEYRYLSALLHPLVGYVAGWGSLAVGFSAPIALDALAAGAFARAVVPGLPPQAVAVTLIVVLTALHAVGLHVSARAQNVLVALKVLLLSSFILVGLTQGSLAWPTWAPPSAPTADGFLTSLFYVSFAFSGWNAAVYAAEEFGEPKRDVPFAMLVGASLVAGVYLLANFVFVANLTPADGSVVFNYGEFASGAGQWAQVTLGQAVMARLLGPGAAQVMSGVMVLLFVSAMSAMIFIGPRVIAAMAHDGYLPKALAPAEGKPPVGGLLIQSGFALVVVFTHQLRSVLENVGAMLVLFAALTAAGVFRGAKDAGTPVSAKAAAGVYVVASAAMLYVGFKNALVALGCSVGFEFACAAKGPNDSPSMILWVLGITGLATAAWLATKRAKVAP